MILLQCWAQGTLKSSTQIQKDTTAWSWNNGLHGDRKRICNGTRDRIIRCWLIKTKCLRRHACWEGYFSHACHQRKTNSRYARVCKLQKCWNSNIREKSKHVEIVNRNFTRTSLTKSEPFHRQWGRNESSKTAGLGTIVRQPKGEIRLHHISSDVSLSSARQWSRIASAGRVGAIQTREHSHPPTLKPQVRRTYKEILSHKIQPLNIERSTVNPNIYHHTIL